MASLQRLEAIAKAVPQPPAPAPAAKPTPQAKPAEKPPVKPPAERPTRPTPRPAKPKSNQWAWPVKGHITSSFGSRRDPITGKAGDFHSGLDIGAPAGTPVKTPSKGRVVYAGWNGGYGNHVAVDHGNGLVTTYSHMSAINVKKGQTLAPGQVVGKVGSTGRSTGPHLHFEVKRHGKFVDPRPMLP